MRYLLYLAVIAFAIWTAATSLTQVESHQRGVVRRFGFILPEKPMPGLHIGLPWGIDRIELAPVGRDRTIKVGFNESAEMEEDVIPAGQMLTGDHNLVNVTASINLRVSEMDPERYVLQKDQIDVFVARAAESLMAEWIAGRTVDEVLQQGQSKLPHFLLEQLPARLSVYGLGIQIESVSTTLTPPKEKEVRDAFERLTQAQSRIRTRITEAEEYANKKQNETAAKTDLIRRETEAHAVAERRNATTEAQNFKWRLAQYKEMVQTNPEYLNTVWLDEMTRMYKKMGEEGRIELLDHYLTSEGLSITQFPLLPKKK
jgi:membrane protease subunit HflK